MIMSFNGKKNRCYNPEVLKNVSNHLRNSEESII